MSEHKIPTNMEEFTEAAFANQKITGFGLGTTTHLPCPFCAAPDFMVYTILETEHITGKPHMCRVCGRGARVAYTHKGSSTRLEIVQTGGDPQPEWLKPKMRVAPYLERKD
jgi:hypothetical protein